MGNNHLHHTESLVSFPGSAFQLNVLDVSPPVTVLTSYMKRDHLVFITYEAVECFYNNSRVYEYTLDKPHNISAFYVAEFDLFVSEDTGMVTKLDAVTLEIKEKITPSQMLPGRIISLLWYNESLFLGHSGGDVSLVSLPTRQITQIFQSSQIAPIETMSFSKRYNLLCVSIGTRDEVKVKLISTRKKMILSLAGLKGKVTGLVVFDDKNLIMASDSLNQVALWDLITGNLLVTALLPEFFPACINTCICRIGLAPMGFALGFSNNAVAWGALEYSEDACQYFFKWKGRSKSSTDGNVVSLMYLEDTCGILLTSDRAITLVLNDLNRDVKVVQKKPLFAISQHEENIDYSTNIKIFRRNLTNKTQPVVSQDVVNRIRERVDGKRGSCDKEEDKKAAGGLVAVVGVEKGVVGNKALDLGEGKSSVIERHEENLGLKGEIEDIQLIETKDIQVIEVKNIQLKEDKNIQPIEKPSEQIPKSLDESLKFVPPPEIKNSEILESDPINPPPTEDLPKELPEIKPSPKPEPKLEESKSPEPELALNTEVEKIEESKEVSKPLTALLPETPQIQIKPQEKIPEPRQPLPEEVPLTEPKSEEISLATPSIPTTEDIESVPIQSESQISEPSPLVPPSEPVISETQITSPDPPISIPQSIETHLIPAPLEELNTKNEIHNPIIESKAVIESNLIVSDQNLKSETVPVISKSIDEESKKSEPVVQVVKKPQTPFQVFLAHKKPEILQDNPTATHKEIVMKVTQLWGSLSESEKHQYSSS